jgi:hypothetical protein
MLIASIYLRISDAKFENYKADGVLVNVNRDVIISGICSAFLDEDITQQRRGAALLPHAWIA